MPAYPLFPPPTIVHTHKWYHDEGRDEGNLYYFLLPFPLPLRVGQTTATVCTARLHGEALLLTLGGGEKTTRPLPEITGQFSSCRIIID